MSSLLLQNPRRARVFLSSILVLSAFASCGPDLAGRRAGGAKPPQPRPSNLAPNADEVRFAVIGDFGTGKSAQQAVANVMCAHHALDPFEHVVTTGDNVYAHGEPEDFKRDFFEPYACLFEAGVEFHASLGNHDLDTDGGQPELAEPAFGMPAPYYAWILGPVAFVVLEAESLDSEIETGSPEEQEQYAWMLERLERFQTKPWTVVVVHNPVFSSGQHKSEPGWDEALGEPFAELGVDLVLNGHDHNFQTAKYLGVQYIVTGGGGAALYECEKPFEPQTRNCVEAHHFLEVDADLDAMTVTATSKQDESLATVEVEQNL